MSAEEDNSDQVQEYATTIGGDEEEDKSSKQQPYNKLKMDDSEKTVLGLKIGNM